MTRLSQLSSRLKALHDGRSAQQKRMAADANGSIAILSLRASIFETLKLLGMAATAPPGSSWERT